MTLAIVKKVITELLRDKRTVSMMFVAPIFILCRQYFRDETLPQSIERTYDDRKSNDHLSGCLSSANHSRRKKNTILSALELFAKQSYDGTSTAEIAEAASVSQETVFKYFTTKENLLLEVINPVLLPVFGGFFTHLNEKKL